ncbi:MAG: hypothetical protein KDC54_03465 [Lewinella sp.]|nr:hypothetical protein [Lewinella sp.]
MLVRSLTFTSLLLLALASCSEPREAAPDVSHLDASLEIHRFEQDLFGLDTNNLAAGLQALRTEYPEFLDIFTTNVLEIGPIDDPSQAQLDFLRGMIEFPALRKLQDTIQIVYPNLSDIQAELEQALRYYQYYFPDQPAPQRLVTYLSEYTYAAFLYGQNDLAVGLDMFLGADYPYQRFNPGNAYFSNYLIRTYNRDHLTAKVVRVLVEDLLPPTRGDRLLDMMIENGKRLYFMEKLLPEMADTVLFEVTPEQMTWLRDNELNMWSYFLSEDLLYSSQYQDIRKLVEPSPSGQPILPPESPGGAANYIGLRIVAAFMERHPELPLSELLLYNDTQQILDDSRYKPRRQ